jgi:hypothetical protein
MPKMPPLNLYRLIELLQVGDGTPLGLWIHSEYRREMV